MSRDCHYNDNVISYLLLQLEVVGHAFGGISRYVEACRWVAGKLLFSWKRRRRSCKANTICLESTSDAWMAAAHPGIRCAAAILQPWGNEHETMAAVLGIVSPFKAGSYLPWDFLLCEKNKSLSCSKSAFYFLQLMDTEQYRWSVRGLSRWERWAGTGGGQKRLHGGGGIWAET